MEVKFETPQAVQTLKFNLEVKLLSFQDTVSMSKVPLAQANQT
jgi:hypothetical protein